MRVFPGEAALTGSGRWCTPAPGATEHGLKRMYVLGLSFDYHDAAAAILKDGVCLAAAEEERFSRVKHDSSYPKLAVRFCLEQAGISPRDLGAVVFYEKPLVKFDRLVVNSLLKPGYLFDSLDAWIAGGKFDPFARVVQDIGVPRKICKTVDHHKSHAASTYFASGFDEATIVTLDGVGEYETANIWHAEGGQMKKLRAMHFPHSLGLFYSAMTAFLGFEVNEGEYKVMGMAGFGSPRHVEAIRKLIHFDGKQIRADLSYFNFRTPKLTFARPKLMKLLGEPRTPENAFRISPQEGEAKDSAVRYREPSLRRYCRQRATGLRRDDRIAYVRSAVEETGVRQVCLAGGVALNSLANGRVARELGVDLYIQPAAGDGGGALGAAWAYWNEIEPAKRPPPMYSPYLGRAWEAPDIQAALDDGAVDDVRHCANDQERDDLVAQILADGLVVGWCQGRFEWGPRALGARSIIAHPGIPGMQDKINRMIKFREPFRPFAPVVLAEHAAAYFELPSPISDLAPERFMLSVCAVREQKKAEIPAVTHVDGTARVQVVGPGSDAPYRPLLERFYEKTGVPVLVNTSFNRRGEPMVSSPADAVRTYAWSGIDAISIGHAVAVKADRRARTRWGH